MDEHTVQIEKAANREVKVALDPLDLETSHLEEELSRLESQYSPEIVSSCRACLERLIQKRLSDFERMDKTARSGCAFALCLATV